MIRQFTDKEILQIIGERARVYRRMHDMSQEELAKACGVSTSTIQHFETGKGNITLSNFIKLLRHIGQIETLDIILPEQPESPYKN